MQRLHIHSFGEVYLGRQPGSHQAVNLGSPMMASLTCHWLQSGRNTNLQLFTSVSLAESCYTKMVHSLALLAETNQYS